MTALPAREYLDEAAKAAGWSSYYETSASVPSRNSVIAHARTLEEKAALAAYQQATPTAVEPTDEALELLDREIELSQRGEAGDMYETALRAITAALAERDALTKDLGDAYRDLAEAEARATAAEAKVAALTEALTPLLQSIGDGITSMFEQMTKGDWRDNHGHDVKMNARMLDLQDVMMAIMNFRTDHLGYTKAAALASNEEAARG